MGRLAQRLQASGPQVEARSFRLPMDQLQSSCPHLHDSRARLAQPRHSGACRRSVSQQDPLSISAGVPGRGCTIRYTNTLRS